MKAILISLLFTANAQVTTALPEFMYDEYYDFDLSLLGFDRGRKHRKAKREEAKQRAQEAKAMAAMLEGDGQGEFFCFITYSKMVYKDVYSVRVQ